MTAKQAKTAQDTAMTNITKDAARSTEIMAVFANHNFYANGLTPEELRTTLEDLGPTYVKIGQIASSRRDLLPERYCTELAKLRENVEPLDAAVTRQVIEEETGRKIEEIYTEFADVPIGSASIAQAHYGVLADGRRVVTKVQRPGIAEVMHRDFEMLDKLARLVGIFASEDGAEVIDLKAALGELERATSEELDFRIEAENTRLFREECIEDDARVSCPEIIDELSTERILTMTYVDGYSVGARDRIIADGYSPHAIADALIENYLHQMLDVGIFHADPHQGNIMLSGGVPYWIDFGTIGRVDARTIDTIQRVLVALMMQDADELTDAALSLGRPTKKVNRAKLVEDVDGMIAKYYPFTDLDFAAVITDLMQILTDHSIEVPAEYTVLGRSVITFVGVLQELSPEADFFG